MEDDVRRRRAASERLLALALKTEELTELVRGAALDVAAGRNPWGQRELNDLDAAVRRRVRHLIDALGDLG